jgi:hypothetical protein
VGQQHVNLSTRTAVSNGLSYIQFLGAGSRMLRSVFYRQYLPRFWTGVSPIERTRVGLLTPLR